MSRAVTPSQFLVPFAGASFFAAEIFAFGDSDSSLLRQQVIGVLLLAAIGGWRLGMWTRDRQAADTGPRELPPEDRSGPPS